MKTAPMDRGGSLFQPLSELFRGTFRLVSASGPCPQSCGWNHAPRSAIGASCLSRVLPLRQGVGLGCGHADQALPLGHGRSV
jgi:hypothetical protein